MLKPGDTILGMNLAHGGHLTHGHPLNFSGKFYTISPYGVRKDDERLDYEEFERLAREHRPKMIVVGASAYPRQFDFARIRAVANDVGSLVMTVLRSQRMRSARLKSFEPRLSHRSADLI